VRASAWPRTLRLTGSVTTAAGVVIATYEPARGSMTNIDKHVGEALKVVKQLQDEQPA
jgi:hypothetical protein